MATFSYNIFKNPNNDGLYYADHFHDINSGINISSNYGHKHVNNNITHFRSPATTTPHLHRKWIVDESNPSVNGPVFRTQFNSNNFTNASLAMQPITRPFDYVPIITEEEVGVLENQIVQKQLLLRKRKNTIRWAWCTSDKSEELRASVLKNLGIDEKAFKIWQEKSSENV